MAPDACGEALAGRHQGHLANRTPAQKTGTPDAREGQALG